MPTLPIIPQFEPRRPPAYQWTCSCRRPPLVLATYDLGGRVAFTDVDRYWQIDGRIATNCPACGKQHLLHLQLEPALVAALPHPWRSDGKRSDK